MNESYSERDVTTQISRPIYMK